MPPAVNPAPLCPLCHPSCSWWSRRSCFLGVLRTLGGECLRLPPGTSPDATRNAGQVTGVRSVAACLPAGSQVCDGLCARPSGTSPVATKDVCRAVGGCSVAASLRRPFRTLSHRRGTENAEKSLGSGFGFNPDPNLPFSASSAFSAVRALLPSGTNPNAESTLEPRLTEGQA